MTLAMIVIARVSGGGAPACALMFIATAATGLPTAPAAYGLAICVLLATGSGYYLERQRALLARRQRDG